jgi:putative nucleotidyltransferase with HDIG domain
MTFTASESAWFGERPSDWGEREADESLAALVAKIHGLRPLSATVSELIRMTGESEASFRAIADAIERDPSIAGGVLRLVNSAGFGLRERCRGVEHAVALLGPRQVRKLAMTVGVFSLLLTSRVPTVLYEHGLAVAAICRRLAPTVGADPDDAFLVGLFHDIGKLLFLQVDEEGRYAAMLEGAGSDDELARTEAEHLGFDHAVLGARVLEAWRIPEPVPAVARLHHDVPGALASSASVATLTLLTRLADEIVTCVIEDPWPSAEALTAIARGASATALDLDGGILGGMWGALRTACGQETPERRRGEVLHVAPARVEAVQQRVADARCVTCGGPAFGEACPCCGGAVCPSHDDFAHRWCEWCEARYRTAHGAREGALLQLVIGCGALLALGVIAGVVALAEVAAIVLVGALGEWIRRRVGARASFRRETRAHHDAAVTLPTCEARS